MNWIILIIGGLFEVGFATCMGKAGQTTGWTSKMWWVGFLACLAISMLCLMRATNPDNNGLPIGTAYAVWTGIGAVGSVLVGILWFNEPAHFWRIFFLCTLIASIVGLKYVSAA